MTPLSCSLVVRALASSALMTPFPAPCSTSIYGPFVGSQPLLFSAFRRHSYTRCSNSPRNKTGVVFFRWFLPDWCTINILRYSRCFSEDAILCCFSVVTRCTSPLRMVLGVHSSKISGSSLTVLAHVFLLFFVYWLPTVVALRQRCRV